MGASFLLELEANKSITKGDMEKSNITIDAGKCTECMCCQLICSFTHTGSFNPEKACIVINPPDDIRFTEECKEGCRLCAIYCEYGAITLVKEG